MRSGIGNSASDPLFVSQSSGGAANSSTNPQFTQATGAGSMATAQVVVATTATLIAAARAGRVSVKISNITGAQQVFVGNTGVTAGTGALIPATVGGELTIATSAAVYGIAVTAAQTVSVLETY